MAITLFEAFSYLSVGFSVLGAFSRFLGESLLEELEMFTPSSASAPYLSLGSGDNSS
jgi:hypothetical protein